MLSVELSNTHIHVRDWLTISFYEEGRVQTGIARVDTPLIHPQVFGPHQVSHFLILNHLLG